MGTAVSMRLQVDHMLKAKRAVHLGAQQVGCDYLVSKGQFLVGSCSPDIQAKGLGERLKSRQVFKC